LGNRIIRNRE